jgi:hypothetical protein
VSKKARKPGAVPAGPASQRRGAAAAGAPSEASGSGSWLRAALVGGVAGVIVLAALAGLFVWRAQGSAEGSAWFRPGDASYCAGTPAFVSRAGFAAALSTSQKFIKGLALVPIDGSQRAPYRHPSWDDAGYLGPFARLEDGTVLAAPVPQITLRDNPPQGQNTIWRVDPQTAEMAPWLELPPAQPIRTYGILDMAYDCDTRMLYITSVGGSTLRQEVGRVFRVDVGAARVVEQLEGIDAIGVGVYNGPQGKQLYLGSARTPEVRVLALGEQGAFAGQPATALILPGEGGANRARRIGFDSLVDAVAARLSLSWQEAARTIAEARARPGSLPQVEQLLKAYADPEGADLMRVEGFSFNFTLQAGSEVLTVHYVFAADANAPGGWRRQ